MLYYIIWDYTILYYIVLYSIVFYFIILYYIMLFILYYIILSHMIWYYIILYCIIVYYIISYFQRLRMLVIWTGCYGHGTQGLRATVSSPSVRTMPCTYLNADVHKTLPLRRGPQLLWISLPAATGAFGLMSLVISAGRLRSQRQCENTHQRRTDYSCFDCD